MRHNVFSPQVPEEPKAIPLRMHMREDEEANSDPCPQSCYYYREIMDRSAKFAEWHLAQKNEPSHRTILKVGKHGCLALTEKVFHLQFLSVAWQVPNVDFT
jgi:hypothetical protein